MTPRQQHLLSVIRHWINKKCDANLKLLKITEALNLLEASLIESPKPAEACE